MAHTDVLIIGGGPAGTATALHLLLHAGLQVIVAEASAYEEGRVGEHVDASLFPLLEYIGLHPDKEDKERMIAGYDSLAAWGNENIVSRHSIYNTDGKSYQLDRDNFDLSLAEAVEKNGGQLFPRTRAIHFQQDGDNWTVLLRHETKGDLQVTARFLVDATGRKSQVCRQLGLQQTQHDQLVGIGAYLHFHHENPIPQQLLLETVEQGWWYSATLPDRRFALTLFTDADLVKTNKWQQQENWIKLLSATRHINKLSSGAYAYGKPWVRNAFSQITDTSTRTNFLAVGDAAASFDPISSMGIGFAVSSACFAAIAIRQNLEGDAAQLDIYRADIKKQYDQYLQLRERYYHKEKRWADAPFWKRRLVYSKNSNSPVMYK
jgi:flavin-dependent dehydrogenase